jgi:MFS transporter, MHS family, shikimate and dehydroshikimate transport protein
MTTATPGSPVPTTSPAEMRKVAGASLIGSAIEWYDFFLYGTAAALVFNRLFFPESSELAGTLFAFATFGVGFFARPVGAVVCGHLGDKVGRKRMLVWTLVVMGLATALIGLLPSYETIGVAAPVLLVVLRIAQGFAVGGEWGGAALMAVEHAPDDRRGYYGSWPQLGVPIGLMLSTAVFAVVSQLSDEAFLAWGWRIPFILSLLLVAVGLFIRLRVAESPVFARLQKSGEEVRAPIIEVFKRHPKQVLLSAGMRFTDNIAYYVFATFALTYLTGELGISRNVALLAVLVASALELVLMPYFGALSDRIGRRPVMIGGSLVCALMAFPYFVMVGTTNPYLVVLATVLMIGVGHAAVFAPLSAFFSELFGTGVRYSGTSVGFQLGALVAGAPTPFIATALLASSGGEPWLIAGLTVLGALVTIVATWLVAETYTAKLAD